MDAYLYTLQTSREITVESRFFAYLVKPKSVNSDHY